MRITYAISYKLLKTIIGNIYYYIKIVFYF